MYFINSGRTLSTSANANDTLSDTFAFIEEDKMSFGYQYKGFWRANKGIGHACAGKQKGEMHCIR